VANTPQELTAALETARTRPPVMATTDPQGLIGLLDGIIAEQRARTRPRVMSATSHPGPALVPRGRRR
jgi:hypothetical protein